MSIKSIKDLCYQLVEENKDLFNLKQFDVDNSQNLELINEFVTAQTCCKKYFSLVKEMLELVRYISCDEFLEIFNNNLNQLIDLINSGYQPVIITTRDSISKSNIYYCLYLLYMLQQKGITINHFYETTNDILNEQRNNLKPVVIEELKKTFKPSSTAQTSQQFVPKAVLIYSDDVSYSGNQLSGHVNPHPIFGLAGYEYDINIPSTLSPNIKFFLNIVGLLPSAYTQVRRQFGNPDNNLIIPTSVLRFSSNDPYVSVENFFNFKYGRNWRNIIKLNDCYILTKKVETNIIILTPVLNYEYNFNNQSILDLSLVIPFNKYPDGQSTFGKLCYIRSKQPGLVTLNIDNFLTTFGKTSEDFLRFYNTDLNTMLRNLDIPKYETIIKNLYNNFDDHELLKKCLIPWIDICSNTDEFNGESVINENGSWLKTLKNGVYSQNFSGKCYEPSNPIIPSFYKSISYNLKGTNINKVRSLYELTNEIIAQEATTQADSLAKKYAKYKQKYINLKKKN